MQRKLIRLSPSTTVVSLPTTWVRANNLKKGTEVSLQEIENNLIISAKKEQEQKEITLDVSTLPTKLVWTVIHAAYTAGYDSIIINTKDQQQTAYMNTVVRYFPGMIIYDERSTSVSFKELAKETNVSVEKLINRLFHLITAFIEDGATAIKQKNLAELADMKKRDYTINSHTAYCLRHINKYGYTPFSKIGTISVLTKTLELFADKLAELFVDAGTKRQALKTETISQILTLFKQTYQLNTNYTLQKLNELERARQQTSEIQKTQTIKELIDLIFALEETVTELHT